MSSGDPYEIIGVKRDASQSDIQKAYRRLAKSLHPDLNPGDADAERKFKEVSAAYDILRDPEKRARFDRGEIDATGAEKPQPRYYRDYARAEGMSNAYWTNSGFADFGEGDDILSQFFSRGGRGRRGRRIRGGDTRYRLEVDFLDALNGATRRITLPDGSILDIKIPPGTRDGQVLRLKGKGEPGIGGAEAGDALVEIAVRPHPFYRRDGDDIRFDLPISLREAVLGGRITVPTPHGPVTVRLPKNSNTGKVIRLKEKGAPRRGGGRGDAYITLKVMLPPESDPELEQFVRKWSRSYNPRQELGV